MMQTVFIGNKRKNCLYFKTVLVEKKHVIIYIVRTIYVCYIFVSEFCIQNKEYNQTASVRF